jgi:hypothetical protein
MCRRREETRRKKERIKGDVMTTLNDGLLNDTSVVRDSKFAPLMFRH